MIKLIKRSIYVVLLETPGSGGQVNRHPRVRYQLYLKACEQKTHTKRGPPNDNLNENWIHFLDNLIPTSNLCWVQQAHQAERQSIKMSWELLSPREYFSVASFPCPLFLLGSLFLSKDRCISDFIAVVKSG